MQYTKHYNVLSRFVEKAIIFDYVMLLAVVYSKISFTLALVKIVVFFMFRIIFPLQNIDFKSVVF